MSRLPFELLGVETRHQQWQCNRRFAFDVNNVFFVFELTYLLKMDFAIKWLRLKQRFHYCPPLVFGTVPNVPENESHIRQLE